MAWYSGCARTTSTATASMPTSGSPARYLRHAPKNVSRTCSRVGSNIPGLRLELAKVADQALRAARLAREADVAPVQDQPVVGVLEKFRRRELQQPVLDFPRILSRGEAGPVGDAEDVGVDRHGGLAESGIEDHVGGLAAHPRQRLEGLAIRRHL